MSKEIKRSDGRKQNELREALKGQPYLRIFSRDLAVVNVASDVDDLLRLRDMVADKLRSPK